MHLPQKVLFSCGSVVFLEGRSGEHLVRFSPLVGERKNPTKG